MNARILLFKIIIILSAFYTNAQTPFTIDANNRVGIGTDFPSSAFEVVGDTSNVELRISSSCGFCSAQLSFLSDRGFGGEWRPGFIRSGDNSNFKGRLDFYTNGFGSNNKFGELYAMSVTNGRLGINETSPESALHVNGYTKLGDDAPKIKMKKFTGVFEGLCGNTSINTGLFSETILAVDILAGDIFKYRPNSITMGFQYEFIVTNNPNGLSEALVDIDRTCDHGMYLEGQAYTVLVTYEEN